MVKWFFIIFQNIDSSINKSFIIYLYKSAYYSVIGSMGDLYLLTNIFYLQ